MTSQTIHTELTELLHWACLNKHGICLKERFFIVWKIVHDFIFSFIMFNLKPQYKGWSCDVHRIRTHLGFDDWCYLITPVMEKLLMFKQTQVNRCILGEESWNFNWHSSQQYFLFHHTNFIPLPKNVHHLILLFEISSLQEPLTLRDWRD